MTLIVAIDSGELGRLKAEHQQLAVVADADIMLGHDGDDYLDGQGDSRDTINGGSGDNLTIKALAAELALTFTLLPDWLDRS